MRYVDQNGNQLTSVDLTKGYLVDKEYVTHPAQKQKGHYIYERNHRGGVLQTYIVDAPARSEYTEVTVQMFVPYESDVQTAAVEADVTDAYKLKGD